MIKINSIRPITKAFPRNTALRFAERRASVSFNPSELHLDINKLPLALKNNITMVQDIGKMHYSFYDGEQKIGYAVFGENSQNEATKGAVPESWIIEGLESSETGKFNIKPNVYISEFVIEDRVGLEGDYRQRNSGRKYGTMCMQKILKWAEEHFYGSRICLSPGKTHSDIHPGKFYAKIGFEMAPDIIELVKKTGRFEQVDGRLVSKGQNVFLTNPDVLKNYPIK